jgi:hypothetical protein
VNASPSECAGSTEATSTRSPRSPKASLFATALAQGELVRTALAQGER